MLQTKHLLFCIAFILYTSQYVYGYRKYYVEDECMPSNKKHKIILRLPATGPDSVGEIRSNRFGTYSRTERNCLLKLSPPIGYGVVLTVLKIDFRNRENCKDFIKVLTSDDEEEKLCGCEELGLRNHTYFSDEEIRIFYHTSGVGMGFNKGIRLVFTVTKLDDGCSLDQFRCQNSHCIWAGVTCDGINNCGDASDESFSDYPFCRTYQQISKNIFSLLAEITPIALTAVILGIISCVAIFIAMCVCCCRTRPEILEKPYLFRQIPSSPSGGYIPVPGYTYGATGNTLRLMQPVNSHILPQPTPVHLSNAHPNVPLMQPKVEIRYDRPPPYGA